MAWTSQLRHHHCDYARNWDCAFQQGRKNLYGYGLAMSVVIRVEDVSKLYRLGQVSSGTLSADLTRMWARIRGKEDPFLKIGQTNDRTKKAASNDSTQKPSLLSRISPLAARDSSDLVWALKDINFEVKEGEVLGIIGRNGAGKSTLLKLLARVTQPTTGQIKVRGRIASLLEVGTGFHPDLTGRENIFLNGAILGMRKHEIHRKLDEIIDFSGCERYIDTPVKRYSSGMYVRLAFAVAAHLEPEILIVDEVLAVGDAEFQKKCLGKMQDVATGGRTVLFVSHNMTAVRSLCSRGVLMKNGQLAFIGETEECIRQYLMAAGQIPSEAKWKDAQTAPNNGKVWVRGIRAVSERTDGLDPLIFDMATPISIEVDVEVVQKSVFHVTLVFSSDQGAVAFTSGSKAPRDTDDLTELGYRQFTCCIPANLLNEGGYYVRLLVVEDQTRIGISVEDAIGFDVKDLAPRMVGSWHGREPGPVRPHLEWRVAGLTSDLEGR